MKIGVLNLQGAAREHLEKIKKMGFDATYVYNGDNLRDINALIMPGGESTTMSYLASKSDFYKAFLSWYGIGKPILATCAGLILLSKRFVSKNYEDNLGLLDINVKRNAFGRQIDSFEQKINIKDIACDFNAVFIRAPVIQDVGKNVEVLAKLDNHIVAVRQEGILATSFHPELTDDDRLYSYFINFASSY